MGLRRLRRGRRIRCRKFQRTPEGFQKCCAEDAGHSETHEARCSCTRVNIPSSFRDRGADEYIYPPSIRRHTEAKRTTRRVRECSDERRGRPLEQRGDVENVAGHQRCRCSKLTSLFAHRIALGATTKTALGKSVASWKNTRRSLGNTS